MSRRVCALTTHVACSQNDASSSSAGVWQERGGSFRRARRSRTDRYPDSGESERTACPTSVPLRIVSFRKLCAEVTCECVCKKASPLSHGGNRWEIDCRAAGCATDLASRLERELVRSIAGDETCRFVCPGF